MKYLVARWEHEEGICGLAMNVVCSSHPRFSAGTRFDFGFLSIASDEGYCITILPCKTTSVKAGG